MKFFLYAMLIAVEYCLGQIAWLLLKSMVLNGLSPVVGGIVIGFFLLMMVQIWLWGSKNIRD